MHDDSDDTNTCRQMGICYACSNGIMKNLSVCSTTVKANLFMAICSIMCPAHTVVISGVSLRKRFGPMFTDWVS